MRAQHHRLALIIGCSVIVGSFSVRIVDAVIPDSQTSLITACRNNASGSLGVLDDQVGVFCKNMETQLTWSGARSAIARFDYVPSDPHGPGVFSPQESRGIDTYKAVVYEGLPGYCIHVPFRPKFVSPNLAYTLHADDQDERSIVSTSCGPGFEYLSFSLANTSVFFTE